MLNHARKFGVMYEMFLDKSYLSTLSVDNNDKNIVDPYSVDRYKDDETQLQGIYAELYDEIPKDFHARLRENKDSASDKVSIR